MIIVEAGDGKWSCAIGRRRFTVPIPEGWEFKTPYEIEAKIDYACMATYPKSMYGKIVDKKRTDCNYVVKYELSEIVVYRMFGDKKPPKWIR